MSIQPQKLKIGITIKSMKNNMTNTLQYLKSRFGEYYAKNDIQYPIRFGRREYGFILFDYTSMIRHLGFSSRNEIKKYILTRIPMHAYYSSAYYEKPFAKTMNEKKWLGADLIFDLDADHIEQARGLGYEEMLKIVKQETIKLIDNFLLTDLGFDEKHVHVNFSGSRGYHIHVTDQNVCKLNSDARREIVDYLEGIDVNVETVYRKIPYTTRAYRTSHGNIKKSIKYRYELSTDIGGWIGKIHTGMKLFAYNLEKRTQEEIMNYFISRINSRLKKSIAYGIYKDLFDGRKGTRGIDKIKNGNIDIFSEESHLNWFLRIVLTELKVELSGTADEPVTTDVKRLIRIVNSLHGKTGLRVMSVNIDNLKEFNPLYDAVVFSSKPVKVNVHKPFKIKLKNEYYNVDTGETELPEYVVVYLLARGFGEKI